MLLDSANQHAFWSSFKIWGVEMGVKSRLYLVVFIYQYLKASAIFVTLT